MFIYRKAFLFFLLNMSSWSAQAAYSDLPRWNYEGPLGTSAWGSLNPNFKLCSKGKKQSPIEIDDNQSKIDPKLALIQFGYKSSVMDISNDGHTIQLNFKNGSKLLIGDKEYKLVRFHFHAPAEHILNGKKSDIEVHFVHRDNDGHFAIVALMMNKGKRNYALQEVFDNFPKMSNSTRLVKDKKLNPLDFFPTGGGYYTYSGSFTTPPCTENVTWIILRSSIEASLDQIMKFTSLYRMNTRPTQPLNGRKVLQKL